MTIAVDVAREGVRVALSEARIREIVRTVCRREHVREALLSVTFVGRRRIAKMNSNFLGHTGATDILTFELTRTPGAIVGDIYIAPEIAAENARALGVGVRQELLRLVVHGVLHVLGYTHADGAGRTKGEMWQRQERIVAALG